MKQYAKKSSENFYRPSKYDLQEETERPELMC